MSVLEAINAAKAPPKDRYLMPKPEFGLVRWQHHTTNRGAWSIAIVTQFNGGSIDCLVFPVGSGGRPANMEGAKHVSDPSLGKMVTPNPGGIWEFTEGEQLVRAKNTPAERPPRSLDADLGEPLTSDDVELMVSEAVEKAMPAIMENLAGPVAALAQKVAKTEQQVDKILAMLEADAV